MNDSKRRVARWLGYGGLIPFLGLSGYIVYLELSATSNAELSRSLDASVVVASLVLYTYAAVILSFVGAVHWGHAMHRPEISAHSLVWSVVPALIAWCALAYPLFAKVAWNPDRSSTVLLMLGFVAQLAADSRLRGLLPRDVFPDWFWRMRIHLTIGACMSLSVPLVIR